MQHRLLSMDPGTVNVGCALSEIGERMVVKRAATVHIARLVNEENIREHGKNRLVRKLIFDYVYSQLEYWRPTAVISEVPYLNESLNSFLSLYTCNLATKDAIRAFSPTMQFIGIDPASAKKSLGIPGNSGDKDLVFEKVVAAEHIDLSNIFPNQLDEHSIDAILIGNAYYQHYHQWGLKWKTET